MPWFIDLAKVKSIPGCKKEWQVGGCYCAWSKIASIALGTSWIADGSDTYGYCNMNGDASEFFMQVRTALGHEKFQEIIDLNDSEGSWEETHEAAVMKAIEYGTTSGLFILK